MRIFLAVEVPESVRELLHSAQQELTARGVRGVRWVDPNGIHLTLRFCGEVCSETVGALKQKLSPGPPYGPFRVLVGGLGMFPPQGRPRVLWMGVEAIPPLRNLAAWTEERVVEAGLPPEKRPFHPHLTLGRFRAHGGWCPAGLLRPPPESDAKWLAVDRLILFESHLGSQGARYRALQSFPLVGTHSAEEDR